MQWRPRKPSRAELAIAHAAYDTQPGAESRWSEFFRVKPSNAKKGRMSNAARGASIERLAMTRLAREGYTCVQSHMSKGAADILAVRARLDVVGPPARAVQAKSRNEFRPDVFNDAVRYFLGYDRKRAFEIADGTRECWLYLFKESCWAAEAVIEVDGSITVTGPRREAVQEALDAMLATERALRTEPLNTDTTPTKGQLEWQRQKGLN